LAASDVEAWAKALGDDHESTRLCRRDYDLIWHIGTRAERNVEHRVVIVDWQSKTRGEVRFEERACAEKENNEWKTIRNHWQFLLSAGDVEGMYPYLELYSFDEDTWRDEDEYVPHLELANGDEVPGEDYAGELFEYVVGARLNSLGEQLLDSVRKLAQMELLEINKDVTNFISIAPWHHRSV
jgi:hypothetical protein